MATLGDVLDRIIAKDNRERVAGLASIIRDHGHHAHVSATGKLIVLNEFSTYHPDTRERSYAYEWQTIKATVGAVRDWLGY